MRVLITGSDGYIGSVLGPFLVEHGHTVAGFDAGYFSQALFVPQPPGSLLRRSDLRDVRAEDLAGFDAVVHLAALSNDPLGQLDPQLTYDLNYRATVRLAELAKQAGVGRFLFSSSCSMYGSATQEMVVETDELRPLTAYASSKVSAERELSALADQGFAPTSLRNATVYGVSPRMRFDLVLNNLAGWAYTTGRIVIQSDGTPWRPLLHVRDLSAAFLAVLEAPRETVANQAINVGRDGDNYQVRDLAAAVGREFRDSVVVYENRSAASDPRSYRVSFGKLRSAFPDLRFEWDVAKGLRELHLAFQQQGVTAERFQHRDFYRLRQIQHLLETGALDRQLRWAAASASPANLP